MKISNFRPSDYFDGTITRATLPICAIRGTYCGYIDFDSKRLWDYEKIMPYEVNILNNLLRFNSRKIHFLQTIQKE